MDSTIFQTIDMSSYEDVILLFIIFILGLFILKIIFGETPGPASEKKEEVEKKEDDKKEEKKQENIITHQVGHYKTCRACGALVFPDDDKCPQCGIKL